MSCTLSTDEGLLRDLHTDIGFRYIWPARDINACHVEIHIGVKYVSVQEMTMYICMQACMHMWYVHLYVYW